MLAIEHQLTPATVVTDAPSRALAAPNLSNEIDATAAVTNKGSIMVPQSMAESKVQQSLTHILTPTEKQHSYARADEHSQGHRSPLQNVTLPSVKKGLPSCYKESDTPHKRKRSASQEMSVQSSALHHGQQGSSSTSSLTAIEHPDRTIDSALTTMIRAGIPVAICNEQQQQQQQQSAHVFVDKEGSSQDKAQWAYPALPDHHVPPSLQSSVSDEQFREALVRETRGSSDSQSNSHAQGYATSPNEGSYHDGCSDQNLTQLQQDENKKRKRNFSNRTKTGCMTCRRRKKKCDETRPECANCVRGGFECNGYPTARTWPTTSTEEHKVLPIPLQAKDNAESGAALPASYGLPQPGYQLPPVQDRREALPMFPRPPQPRVGTHQPQSHILVDERPSTSSLMTKCSYESRMTSATSYPTPSTFTTPISGHPTYHSFVDYKPIRSSQFDLSDQQRIDSNMSHAHPHSLPHINILNSPHPSSSPLLLPGTSAQDAARLALSHPASRPQTQSQRHAMTAGQKFYPNDQELTQERERCHSACWQFNNSNGVSLEERARLFRKILLAKEPSTISPTERSSPVQGRVGQDVIVDGPFTCDYGFNINIGDFVAIGKNCTIMDACEVTIGSKTVLGPNVSIYTEFLSVDPRQRAGSTGPRYAAKVLIEDDCFIGGGVTILPGRVIGRGATVGAMSVVTRDVPPHTIVAGNPAKVLRAV